MGKDSWLVRRTGPEPLLYKKTKAYENHERANETYSRYLSGYTEEEIVKLTGTPLEEVEKDICHIKSVLPLKTIISNENDRNRILLQRTAGENYRNQINQAVSTPIGNYLSAGVNPAGVLKEYREAVGMTEKPGGLNIQVNQTNTTVSAGVSRAEDVIRSVISRINSAKEDNPPIIDVEPEPTPQATEGDPTPTDE